MNQDTKPLVYANRTFYIATGFLFLSILAFILIDLLNFLGTRDWLIQRLDIPYFWYHWFIIPVEIPLQWYMLGATLVFFILIAGIASERKEKEIFRFWLLTGTGVVLMFAEDAGDVRHALRHYVEKLSGETTYGFMGSTFELLYFASIAALITYALIVYRNVWQKHFVTRKYFLIAYIMYGLSVMLSFAGAAYSSVTGFSLYEITGNYFMNLLIIHNEESRLIYEHAKNFARIDFNFMDVMVEESIEFVGASALLAAGLGYWEGYRRKKTFVRCSNPNITAAVWPLD